MIALSAKRRRRQRELAAHAPRRAELEAEITAGLCEKYPSAEFRLVPAPSKGGYDEIYFVEADGVRVGVLRANSVDKINNDPVYPTDPGIPLGPRERIDTEWGAYEKLFAHGLSPEPLWRSGDAAACSWLPGERASRRLARHRAEVWVVLGVVFPAIQSMHDAGVVHMDLNLGNILLNPDDESVSFIDFEFGPSPSVTPEQQRAFDYLRLVDNALKPRRGGRLLSAEPDRLAGLLSACVPDAVKHTEVTTLVEPLARLRSSSDIRSTLQTVFTKMPSGPWRLPDGGAP